MRTALREIMPTAAARVAKLFCQKPHLLSEGVPVTGRSSPSPEKSIADTRGKRKITRVLMFVKKGFNRRASMFTPPESLAWAILEARMLTDAVSLKKKNPEALRKTPATTYRAGVVKQAYTLLEKILRTGVSSYDMSPGVVPGGPLSFNIIYSCCLMGILHAQTGLSIIQSIHEKSIVLKPLSTAALIRGNPLVAKGIPLCYHLMHMGIGAAFFDMDHTITWENSGLSFIKYTRKQGLVSTRHLLKSVFKIILYRLSLLNIDKWYEKNMEFLAGARLDELEGFCTGWFNETLGKAIYREAVSLIEDHRREGLRVAIISNSPSFFVTPMARTLGIEDVITTKVEIRDGRLTGKLIPPLCYGEGKKYYALEWAKEHGIDLGASFFYTDSFFDIALMKVVGHPVATNPDMKLRKAAMEHRWPVRDFKREPAF
jgi:HAD superfamily hydrolase (TIGR01490 family)